jgi:hypothetical protein
MLDHWNGYFTDTQIYKIFIFIHFYYFNVVFIIKIVVMEDELLILVDEWDNHIGDNVSF